MKTYNLPDISHYERVKDWNKLKEKVPFLIFKGTEGTSYIDGQMTRTIKNCETYGIPYWIYTFLHKGNEVKQTEFLITMTKSVIESVGGKYFMGYCLDAEKENDPEGLYQSILLAKSQASSHKAMVYTMYAQYAKIKSAIVSGGHRIDDANICWWEARYGKNDGKYSSKYPPHDLVDLHQYTECGKLDYISGSLDLNRLTGRKDLAWFTSKTSTMPATVDADAIIPDNQFPNLPPRSYFKLGDGYRSYVTYKDDIKKLQKFINRVNRNDILAVDGKYGEKTKAAVKKLQKKLGVASDGEFGRATLLAAKKKWRY